MVKINKKVLFVFACFILLFTATVIVINAVRGNPTEPVDEVVIESNNYDDPGTYHIEKSAKWLDTDKAEIMFDVNTMPIGDGRYKDVVFVIDMSGSMVGERLDTAKKNSKELVNLLLEDEHNSISLISFDTQSEVLSEFTKDKSKILNEIDSLSYRGATNYNAALNNVLEVLDGYEEKDNTDLIVLFLTDGYPNEDTPNQIGTYQILKSMYPYIKVHGVQYEMGDSVSSEIVAISDEQWIAYISSLHNVLIDAVLSPLKYEKYEIVDYIDKDYFYINSVNDIEVSVGNVSVEEENGFQKVIWNFGNNFSTGNNASMKINVQLKNEYTTVEGLYPTNDHEVIKTKIVNNNEKEDESDKTPVLKNYYSVIYDTNTPEGCTLESIESENHFVFTNVTKKQDELSCTGYQFKGWKIVDDDVVRVNDDVFMMPTHDVTLKAIWSKVDISKSMDGKIYEKTTLYKAVENEALNGTEATLYEGETNDGGGEENVYYYKGDTVTKNNVLFGDYCWQIIRTTDTGGVKLAYNGLADEAGKCGSRENVKSFTYFRKDLGLLSSHLYSSSYIFDENSSEFILQNAETISDSQFKVGKYTCLNSQNHCSEVYYVHSLTQTGSGILISIEQSKNQKTVGYTSYNNSNVYLSGFGYMYNKIYKIDKYNLYKSFTLIYETSNNTEFFYSDSYSIENNKYKLDNPQRVGSSSNYSNMVGKYTFRDSSSVDYMNKNIYYVVAVDGSKMYYIQLTYNQGIEDVNFEYSFGEGIRDNQDGTYTLTGTITKIKPSNWYNNYSAAVNKYTCNSSSTTCENPYYLVDANKRIYYYINMANNSLFGNSYQYDDINNVYILKDTTDLKQINLDTTKLNTYHYTCLNTSGKCENVLFNTYQKDNYVYYITLSDNTNVNGAINEMLYSNDVNQKDSNAKMMVDYWYEQNMLNYTDYLEDIIYCNDRTITQYGGWEPNGNIKGYVYFQGLQNNNKLTCPNKNDQFTKSSEIGNGKLKYPVGLITSYESALWAKSSKYLSQSYWTMTPLRFVESGDMRIVGSSSSSGFYSVGKYIRPVISLKPNIEYTEGDGTEDKPYYIPTN